MIKKEREKTVKRLLTCLAIGLIVLIATIGCAKQKEASIGMAVEFMDHAACAYISQDKGWFEKEGLELTTYESYVTGMSLASALGRGDIEAAYVCLVPAINAYANAGIPIKIIAGTHKYGYGLVANSDKIKTVQDLENPDIRIGCVREGGTVDIFLHKSIDTYKLDAVKVLGNIQRMNPPKQALAIKMEQLDAAFLPEQWATMAEEFGFNMLFTSQDIWPELQGSVLIVKEDLLNNRPEIASKLVKVSQKATDWINQHPEEAAEVMSSQLQAVGDKIFPTEVAAVAAQMEISPEILLKSMNRLEYTTDIDPKVVQGTIDYIAGLGYIKDSFKAEDILDLRFLEGE